MNPFSIPGLEPIPAPPLCPWEERTREHEELYVAIDDTRRAFENFKSELAGLASLPQSGWFVLVTGGDGCGKTSLINRCVTTLRERLSTGGTTTTIVNAGPALSAASLAERMEWVCQSVIDEPELAGLVPAATAQALAASCSNPPRFYRLLSGALERLRHDRVIVILLPTSELPKEVEGYINLTYGRIVFFAESADDAIAGELDFPDRRVTRLAVHPLRTGDGLCFANARLSGQYGRGPQVDQEAAEKMVIARLNGPGTSIGALQSLLYRVYQDALQESKPDEVRITFEYLTAYLAKRVPLL